MNLKTLQYTAKLPSLPKTGRHLLTWFDEDNVLVYIPHIGEYYGDKTVSRPIWITPNFLWMMHHADWLESSDYEVIECMLIQRFAFEDMLLRAFPAYYPNNLIASETEWKTRRAEAMIQYRWAKDFAPDGQELQREVLLLGIHSRAWMQYVIQSQIVTYNEIDEALFKQKEHTQPPFDMLVVPDEQPYPLADSIKKILGIES